MTRVVVDEDATEDQIVELAKEKFLEKIHNELYENIEEIEDDLEMPFDENFDEDREQIFIFKTFTVKADKIELNKILRGQSLEERLGDNGRCEACGNNTWWLHPKMSAAVREGGKAYLECSCCGHITHL